MTYDDTNSDIHNDIYDDTNSDIHDDIYDDTNSDIHNDIYDDNNSDIHNDIYDDTNSDIHNDTQVGLGLPWIVLTRMLTDIPNTMYIARYLKSQVQSVLKHPRIS